MYPHIICSVIAATSLLGGAVAGPCKPSTTLALSDSITIYSSSSTSEFASSTIVVTVSSLAPDTTLSTVSDDVSSSAMSDHVSTLTDIILSMSTDDALSSITDASTTFTLTTEATISATATISFVESSRTSAGSTATEDYTTAEGSTTTEDSTTAEDSTTTDGFTTTEGATATQVSTITTEAATTTSDAPSIEPTFALQVANSIRENLNGKKLLYRKGTSGYNIYVTVGASSANLHMTGDFHIEALTNRLMVGDMYASIDGTALVPQTAADVASNNRLYISCTPPVHFGQKLECVVEGTSRTQFHVFNNPSSFTVIYMLAPGSINSNTYSPLDLIVVPV